MIVALMQESNAAGCVQESLEQEDPVLLEGAEPQEDPEGRSYLHILSVEDVQKILERVRGENVQVISVRDLCEWADYLVITSGYSARHLRGIADSIVFEVSLFPSISFPSRA